jgi:RNA polymerase sigma-70 factor, ECF subfamily
MTHAHVLIVEGPPPPDTVPNWAPVVEKVLAGDPTGFEVLYQSFSSLRWYFLRYLDPELVEDTYHNLMLTVATQIRKGDLREPERLAGYVKGIAHNHLFSLLRKPARRCESLPEHFEMVDTRPSAEAELSRKEMVGIARRILRSLPERDRQVLERFYLKEQSPEQIQTELKLTATQFRLIKSRSKARFAELCKSALEMKPSFARAG